MNIITPSDAQIPGLRRLWQAAFGDPDAFLDKFYGTAYAPARCRCVEEKGEITSVLYWFDCFCDGAKLAYIYAVATDPAHRGRGLCKTLMADTLKLLKDRGYQGALLLPQEPWLIRMYEGMGFAACTTAAEFHVMAGEPIPVEKINVEEYARLRRGLLPEGSVIQEGENLAFLETQAAFYTGEGWLAAVTEVDGMLWCSEFLGDPALAPGLTAALGYREGSFRAPGSGRSFAMLRPLSADCPRPVYFGHTFD